MGALVELGMTTPMAPQKKRKKSWFAPRQVYLRTGQESSYVELSTKLQVSVAVGLGLVAIWLLGASYNAVSRIMDRGMNDQLVAELQSTQEKLTEITEEASKIPTLEADLADAETAVEKAQQTDATAALSAELVQTKSQLEELHTQLSKAKAEEATLLAKLEAQTAPGETPSDQPAEEASSLHAQLEDAFVEIENLQKARDEADAKAAALTAENAEKDNNADRSETLLKAATVEIERLQALITEADRAGKGQEAEQSQVIEQLTATLKEERAAGKERQERIESLTAELEQRNADVAANEELAEELQVAMDAERHADAIAAELKEAELLATIEGLRTQIDAGNDGKSGEDVDELKAKLAIAEAEIETILRNTLLGANKNDGEEAVAKTAAIAEPETEEDVKHLKSELSLAQSDIIKLRSDVRAAKKRLAEQADAQPISVSKPDNTVKLEQQLASTRSRMQQLNTALADAKLREVAVDLAIINVVPSPSPPAPR